MTRCDESHDSSEKRSFSSFISINPSLPPSQSIVSPVFTKPNAKRLHVFACELNQRCFPTLGPRTAQSDAAAETAETGLAPKVAALNAGIAATRPETAEAPLVGDLTAKTRAVEVTLTTPTVAVVAIVIVDHATTVVTTAAEATAEATHLKNAEVVAETPMTTIVDTKVQEEGVAAPQSADAIDQTLAIATHTAAAETAPSLQSIAEALLAPEVPTQAQKALVANCEDQGRATAQCVEVRDKGARGATVAGTRAVEATLRRAQSKTVSATLRFRTPLSTEALTLLPRRSQKRMATKENEGQT